MDDLIRRTPFLIAGIGAAVAIALALRSPPAPQDPSPPPMAPPSVNGAPPASATTPPPAAVYEPDLSGEDAGETVVAMGETVSGLAVGEALVWLTTSPAALHTAGAAGGAVTTPWSAADQDAFGGELALGAGTLAWSIEGTETLGRTIHVAPVASPDARSELPRSGSPEHLRWTPTHLLWAERGAVVAAAREGGEVGAPVIRVRREGRIAGLATHAADVYFLEEPLLGRGDRGLFRLRGDAVTRVAAVGDEAADLEVVGEHLVWTEADGVRYRWMRRAIEGRTISLLARCGLVTARVVDGDQLVWAERHEEAPVVTLLRSVQARAPSSVTRLGRDTGLTTALAIGPGGAIYWASEDGIQRITP